MDENILLDQKKEKLSEYASLPDDLIRDRYGDFLADPADGIVKLPMTERSWL